MLLTAAIIADIFSLIPGVNDVVDIIAPIVLEIIAREKGMSLFDSPNIGWTLFTMVLEAVPFISIYPMWTHRVIMAKKAHKKRMEVMQMQA